MKHSVAEVWCAANGVSIVAPGKRPYYLVFKRRNETQCDFGVGEFLAEAVLQLQTSPRREALRVIAPELCNASGGEPWQR